MTPPLIELLVGRDTPPMARELVTRVSRACMVRASDRALGPAAARVATSARAPGLAAAMHDRATPLAVVVARDEDVSSELRDRAELLITDDPARVEQLGPRALLAPAHPVDAERHLAIAPFLRERWRRRLRLPSPFTVVSGFPSPTGLRPETEATALALASAAAVRGSTTLVALALGTPVVTDAATAALLGATDGHDVLVASASNAVEVAGGLAADIVEAARLGREARALVERRHDVGDVARTMLTRLGIVLTPPAVPLGSLQLRLDELHTPFDAPPERRAIAACQALTGARVA
ncbi:MAG TPA: glycosyltransferase [Acidimicrobiia bacterium]|nr:glycosyltransferase [Acidimicrobiia bacterium]